MDFNSGLLTGVFSLGYGASRFIVEYFRVPDPQFFPNLTHMDLLSKLVTMVLRWVKLFQPMIFVGLFLCARCAWQKENMQL